MKVRIRYKANDAVISLVNVPFDVTRQEDIIKAFRELGPDETVEKMVQISERTNKVAKFNITGPDTVLRAFFEKNYSGVPWDDVLSKYSRKPKSKEEKSQTEDVEGLVDNIKKFFRKEKIYYEDVTFIKSGIPGDDDSLFVEGITNPGLVSLADSQRRLSSVAETFGYKVMFTDRVDGGVRIYMAKTKKKKK